MTEKTIAYRASSKHGGRTASTPREAAIAFFEAFPKARKCDVVQGTTDGAFFTVAYGRRSPPSWKDVKKNGAALLPIIVEQEP